MATRMQQRRGTATQWTTADPILNAGEIGFESDTNKFKIGDGINHWSDLAYFADAVTIGGSIDDYIPLTQKGQPNGVAELDGNGKLASLQIPNLDEITQDILDTSLVAGTGLDKTYDDSAGTYTMDIDSTVATKTYADGAVSTHSSDTTSVHGITDTAELATKTFTASLLTGATKTNIVITGDKDGLTISAENGVADSTTSDLAEGSNLYFTDERAQDAVGNAVGTGLSYNDSTGAISVDTAAIQARVADVSDTEIGYLNGVTSAIQTQLNDKAPLASPTFTGTVAGVTKAHVGLGNVDNTSDADKPVSTAAQTALDGKLNLSGGTLTGALTLHADPGSALHAATKQYVDNTASGIVAKPQVLGATTANIDATYDNGTAGVGATLTHNTNGAFPAGAGGASGWALGKGILVKNQTNKAENGRYYVSNMGSASTPYVLTRCGYCDEANEIPGAYIFVQDGTLAGTGWIQVVADPETFVVGTDNIDVFQFSGSGTITAGTNISVTGNQVSTVADPTFTSLTVGDVSNTEFGYLNGVTSAIQTQLDDKAPLASPTFTGTVSLPSTTSIGNVSATELGYVDGVTSAIQTQLDAKIAKADITAKGAILVGTGAGTYSAQTVGTNGQVLTANSAQADGVEWTTVSSYSAPTLGSTSIGSGATVTTIAGLTSVTSTGFTGALTGNASTATTLQTSRNINGVSFNGSADITVTAAAGTLSGSTLASGVTASSLTSVGTLASLAVTGNAVYHVAINSQTGVGYTLVLADDGKVVNMGGSGTLTVPANATVAFPIGTQITIAQTGVSQINVAGAGLAVIRATPGLKLRAQYSTATLIKIATDEWLLVGDLAA